MGRCPAPGPHQRPRPQPHWRPEVSTMSDLAGRLAEYGIELPIYEPAGDHPVTCPRCSRARREERDVPDRHRRCGRRRSRMVVPPLPVDRWCPCPPSQWRQVQRHRSRKGRAQAQAFDETKELFALSPEAFAQFKVRSINPETLEKAGVRLHVNGPKRTRERFPALPSLTGAAASWSIASSDHWPRASLC